jgi:hypothetical protein
MEISRLDRLARELTSASSRRNLLRGLGIPTVGLAVLQLPGWADAKKKHDSDRKRKHDADGKRKRKGKHRKKKNNGETISPPPTPPAAPGPVTTADARCLSAPPAIGEQTGPRLAQTFVAKRSGQLTSASVVLYFNEAGADFELEIREVGVGGTPTSTVLASTVIANVPASVQTRSILGTFDSPATVVAGEVYALVVTETTGLNHSFFINGSDPCLDGILFRDELVNDTFDPRSSQDLVYATFVTA